MNKKKLCLLDLFAGCGGLAEGFEQTGHYTTLAAVEWEKAPHKTLEHRFHSHWGMEDADKRVMLFDMQRSEELFTGWSGDPRYGDGIGLDKAIGSRKVDIVIGGPPCQAYSIAGRIRDANGMRNDYRNFLFESYLKVIERYKPDIFVFENVPGLLSAKPTGELLVPRIIAAFNAIGYAVPSDFKLAQISMSEFGLPQNRKRLIIIGLSRKKYGQNCEHLITKFYSEILPGYKSKKVTVDECIGDLPPLYPLSEEVRSEGKNFSHSMPSDVAVTDHIPRYHNKRDIEIFSMLANDLKSKQNKYQSTEALKKLYTEKTGCVSTVHKYYVLRSDDVSNLIPAHLYKDGLRHIHPDPKQARSITVREAARLQGFPDDFEYLGSMGDKFKMIGNAVPPSIAKIIGKAVFSLKNEADRMIESI